MKKMNFNISEIKKYKIEIILFLVSFCAQLAPFFIWLHFHPYLLFEDKELFWGTAQNIINHGSFSTNTYSEPDAIRMPGYPLFLGSLYLILFKSMALVLFVQNIIGAITTVLVYRLGKSIFNKKAAVFASIIYIFDPEHLGLSSLIRSEVLFIFFFLLSMIYFLKYIKYFYIRYLIYFSLLLGIATLIRPNSQFFFVVYIFIFFLMAVSKKIAFKKFLTDSVVIIFIVLATLSPWGIRNYVRFGTLQLSPIMGYHLYNNLIIDAQNTVLLRQGGGYEDTNENVKKHIIEIGELLAKELQVPRNTYANFEHQKYFLDKSWLEIKKDPWLYIGAYFRCKINYCFNDASAYFINLLDRGGGGGNPIWNIPSGILFPYVYYGMKFVWLFMWLIIAAGLILECAYWLRKKKDALWIMYVFLLSSIIYFAIPMFCGGPLTRYRFPTDPLIFILFAHFLYFLTGQIKKVRAGRNKINTN